MTREHLTRRGLLRATALAAAEWQLSRATAQSGTGRPPNIILFMADELRAESIACYGHPVVKTPNIDRLAAQGTRFAQCHVQNTVCEPSRCSFVTGWPVHVRGHRSLYYGLHPDEPNLFRYLKQAGYDVYWYGKNDLLSPDSFAASVTHAEPGPSAGMFTKNLYPPEDPRFYAFLWEKSGDRTQTGDYANVQSAAKILRQGGDKPFCIFLPLIYPHPPYSAPADFHEMYRPSQLPALRSPNVARLPRFHAELRRRMRLDKLDDSVMRQIQAVYLGQVSYTDWVLGEMMTAIDQSGHAQDTALFFFSDHGDYAGDYGLVEKWPNAMHDVLTRIPLIVRAPGYTSGHVVNEQVELYDVMATCLDLAGVQARHTHFARSLKPQLQGQPGDPARAVFCEGGYNRNEPQAFEPLADFKDTLNPYYPKVALQNEQPETITRSTMMRTTRHKLIYRPDDQSELYDLAKDPREVRNVYGQSSYAKVQDDLFHGIIDWYVRTADVTPKALDPRGFPPAGGK
jgi:arylsulfatase A-like enzyme